VRVVTRPRESFLQSQHSLILQKVQDIIMATRKKNHISITMNPTLIAALTKHMESLPAPPGTKKSVSSYVCNAIIVQLKADGVEYPPATEAQPQT
jgi:hypothetical protein